MAQLTHTGKTKTGPGRRHQRRYAWDQVARAARMQGKGHVGPTIGYLSGLHAIYSAQACVFPSQDTIGKQTGRTERTVRYHVALLVALELVVVYGSRAHQVAGGRYTRATNRYRPAVDVARRLIQHGGPGRAYRKRVASMSPDGDKNTDEGAPMSASPPLTAVPIERAGAPPGPEPDDDGPAVAMPAAIRAQLAAMRTRARGPMDRR